MLRTARATITKVLYLDEVASDATGNVVVTFTRLDGTIVQGPSNAAGPTAEHAYTITFDGSEVLDELTLTWAATVGGDAIVIDTDRIQVVGGFFFGLGEARASDPVLANTTKYPTADIIDRRIETEDECERICGQSFVPRFRRVTLSGHGGTALVLPDPWLRTVRSISVGGSAGTPADYGTDPLGVLRSAAGWTAGTGNIVVEYEHGWDFPPTDIVRASKIRFKSLMLTTKSPLPDRAERLATVEAGTVILASPTREKTGIPDVDAVYARYPDPRPGFG